jgi:dihydroorotate dehydrogenase (NAD+) catalytic subunit
MEVRDLHVSFAPSSSKSLVIKNPIMIASGTFGYDGYGSGITDEMPLEDLGAIIPKTVTRRPRAGNPEPRWHPTSFREARESGECIYLNSIGLANPGIEHALEVLAPEWHSWSANVILSMSAESVGEFAEMAKMTQKVDGFEAIELNLSCPNIEDGAMFSHRPDLARAAMEAVRHHTDLPVWVKLAPNVPDIVELVEAVELAGANGVTLCNTIPAMAIDNQTGLPILGGITGGLSGPALKVVALALVYRASRSTDLPIIGVGGIFSGIDVVEFLMAGASAVQVGSANLANLWAPFNILAELKQEMLQRDIQTMGGFQSHSLDVTSDSGGTTDTKR